MSRRWILFTTAWIRFGLVVLPAIRAFSFPPTSKLALVRGSCLRRGDRQHWPSDDHPLTSLRNAVSHNPETVSSEVGGGSSGKSSSTATNATTQTIRVLESVLPVCQFCELPFGSRNALFRHLRTDLVCRKRAHEANGGGPESLHPITHANVRYDMAWQIAYVRGKDPVPSFTGVATASASFGNPTSTRRPEAERAGILLRKAVEYALNADAAGRTHPINEHPGITDTTVTVSAPTVTLGPSSTQVTVANQRHWILSQPVDTAAAGDVITLSYWGPPTLPGSDESCRARLPRLLNLTQDYLTHATANEDDSLRIRVVSAKYLSSSRRLHAERSCTQQVYHYLLPLRWLPDGDELERWWLRDSKQQQSRDANSDGKEKGGLHTNRFVTPPPSDALRKLRDALRAAESVAVPNRRVRRKPLQSTSPANDVESTEVGTNDSNGFSALPFELKLASSRYGTLAHKAKRAWHNFADPELRGDASPNQEPVWRVLDRARIVEFWSSNTRVSLDNLPTTASKNSREEAIAVLEFRGDNFVAQQIRRIVATALAATHGYTPSDVFEVATRPDVFTKTPIAPGGRLYLQGARFHFDEQRTGEQVFVGEEVVQLNGGTADDATVWVQSELLRQRNSEKLRQEESEWLTRLKYAANKMNLGMDDWSKTDSNLLSLPAAPNSFQAALGELRKIISEGCWPETSIARSNVIRRDDLRHDSKDARAGGSFTVVNPTFRDGLYRDAVGANPLPRANRLFPDLVQAVFALEASLSEHNLKQANGDAGIGIHRKRGEPRPPSSHCAINCNARFTPHVDSGRGAGQSLSMIVGLRNKFTNCNCKSL
jgi:tRNA U38,U39,U40 pseudouridine synthase TruA